MLDRLAVRSMTTITKITTHANIEIMIDLTPIELMIQKVGISAYLRLKRQLVVPSAAQNKKHIPHLQYWENLMEQYAIKLRKTEIRASGKDI